MGTRLDDICVWDCHFGQYLDLVLSHDGTWTLYWGLSRERFSKRGLTYEEGKSLIEQTLIASKIVEEIVWEDDIKIPRMFE